MSGICGIALPSAQGAFDPGYLAAMVRALDPWQRGDPSTLMLGPVGFGARGFPGCLTGVACARDDRALALAFHGSLYNARELLPAGDNGSCILTRLLDLYSHQGLGFLPQLRGDFALCLWDGEINALHVVTDRFRVHPLFYVHDRDTLVFASTVKAITACPLSTQRTVDFEAIVDVVACSVIPTPRTIFREVRKLPPGQVLTYRNGTIRLSCYWDINFLRTVGGREAELAGQLKTRVSDAIAARLEVDAEPGHVGTFLSGGVDSSTVTAILTQIAGHPVRSFSVGFAEPAFNEIPYARIAARAFGVEHHEYSVAPGDVVDAIPVLLEAFDEPFANASAIPAYFCAKIARASGVQVLYAGDGGDELFAGNERYATQRLFEYYGRIPGWLRASFVRPLVFFLAEQFHSTLSTKARSYICRAETPYPDRLWTYGVFEIIAMNDLLHKDFLSALGQDYHPYSRLRDYYLQAPARTELDRQLYVDLKLAICDNDLFKVTRTAQAAGLAVRFPFLDPPLAEFAAAIPARIKMRGRRLRSFFKRAYADVLPPEIRTKRKHGFGLPIAVWLKTDRRLNEMMHDLLLSPRSLQRGYFRRQAVESLIERHRTDATSFYGTVLWNLMVLELWHRTYEGMVL